MKSTTSESGQSTTQPTATTTSVFRTPQEPTAQVDAPAVEVDKTTTAHEKADGLFIGYETDNSVPFVADMYNIRDTYLQDPEAYSEVGDITDYLQSKVNDGELENSTQAVTEHLHKLEQLSGVDRSERTVMKLIRLAEYCNFIQNVDSKQKDMRKYGKS